MYLSSWPIYISTSWLMVLVMFFSTVSTKNEPTVAASCTDEIRQNVCSLPTCRCSGDDIPGNLTRSQVPQMIFLTFDDALNQGNFYFYQDVLSNRSNPNGHPITATFFVSHEYTNYSMVHELWRSGHEMALHSITHTSNVDYWRNLNQSMWHLEIVEQREQMANFANIPVSDIKGMRAPFLQGGGDSMFSALTNDGSHIVSWDCSRPSSNIMLWPYTNDFASTQDCDIPPCAKNAFPGFWTVPMVELVGGNGFRCSMVDSCTPVPETANTTFNFLQSNFLNHYKKNRAPFGIFTHSAWLSGAGIGNSSDRRHGYIKFLDYLANFNDTYIVGISRAIEWIKNPVPVSKLEDFTPFQVDLKQSKCSNGKNCFYKFSANAGERWFHSCASECPRFYPWLGNPLGQ